MIPKYTRESVNSVFFFLIGQSDHLKTLFRKNISFHFNFKVRHLYLAC